jgi:HAD superfamily hydrolase (TIGR01509 family)
VRAAELDAVTVDVYGTLVTLLDPVPALSAALGERGVDRSSADVLAAFETEVEYYARHSSRGRDEEGLIALQQDCAHVFLDALDVQLDAAEFGPVYAGAMRFAPLPGAVESLARLRALGLELAVVANWDLSLHSHLAEIGLARYFRTIVHASRKPAPDGLLQALRELGVESSRALHIGDSDADEQAAAAAGTRFAAAPLPNAVSALT